LVRHFLLCFFINTRTPIRHSHQSMAERTDGLRLQAHADLLCGDISESGSVGLRGSPEDALPAVLEDAVVDEIEVHASSLAVDDERHVIRLHDLVVPAFFLAPAEHRESQPTTVTDLLAMETEHDETEHEPDARSKRVAVRVVVDQEARMFPGDPRMGHGEGVERAVVILPVLVPATTTNQMNSSCENVPRVVQATKPSACAITTAG
jgi:hypothetical protein